MCRFALHRQGQNPQVCTRWPAMACRGSLQVRQRKKHNRFGYRRPELNLQPPAEHRKVFLPARYDRVCTLGASR
jgi:hypothetical protein